MKGSANNVKQPLHMRIDAHQHFWKYSPIAHEWMDESMKVIRKDFSPTDLAKELHALNIDGTVAVQVDQTETETQYLLDLAAEHDLIKAVVGWIDLHSPNAIERMHYWKKDSLLKGFRCIMQGQPDEAYLTNKEFLANVKTLASVDYSYDLLVYHNQFPSLIKFVDKLPDNRMILDHIGKPDIKNKNIKDWQANIKTLAQHPGIYCKLSGMITEADYKHWTYDDLKPYLEIAAEHFGVDRICFGTDWPVCLVAGSYQQVYQVVQKFSTQLTKDQQDKLFGTNTIKFYKL